MTFPKIQARGVTQDWSATHWRARGHVEGVGWLEAWGPNLIEAMAALQAQAAARVAEQTGVPPARKEEA